MANTRLYFDRSHNNNNLVVTDGYSIKDSLKSYGFLWSAMSKAWILPKGKVPSGIELGNLICDIYLAADTMDAFGLADALQSIPGGYEAFELALSDDDRRSKYIAKTEKYYN